MSQLTVSPERLEELAGRYNVPGGLLGAPLVYMSAVLVKDLDDPRLLAVEASLRVTMASGSAAHMVLLDNRSAPGVEQRLRLTEALIVVIDGEKEGGLVGPYIIGLQLVKAFGRERTRVVKVEGEKPIGTDANTQAFLRALRHNRVVVGMRSEETWASMPPYQAMTERLLGPAIGSQLGVPDDTPSGVLGLNPEGIDIMLGRAWKKWEYLFGVPFILRLLNRPVGTVELTWMYPDVIREQETGNPVFDLKRLEQIDAMLDEAEAMAREAGLLSTSTLVTRLRTQRAQWGNELSARTNA